MWSRELRNAFQKKLWISTAIDDDGMGNFRFSKNAKSVNSSSMTRLRIHIVSRYAVISTITIASNVILTTKFVTESFRSVASLAMRQWFGSFLRFVYNKVEQYGRYYLQMLIGGTQTQIRGHPVQNNRLVASSIAHFIVTHSK